MSDDPKKNRDQGLLWFSGPWEAVKRDAYTGGPCLCEADLMLDEGDFIIAKNSLGETVLCKEEHGKRYKPPKRHLIPKSKQG